MRKGARAASRINASAIVRGGAGLAFGRV